MFFLWAVYLTLATDNFATTDNIFTILRQAAIIGITAIGAHFVILMGDMDLSAAAVISLSGVVMGEAMVNQGFAPIPALAALVVGARGLASGLIVTIRINAIITTLGTSSILAHRLHDHTGQDVYGERKRSHRQDQFVRRVLGGGACSGHHPVCATSSPSSCCATQPMARACTPLATMKRGVAVGHQGRSHPHRDICRGRCLAGFAGSCRSRGRTPQPAWADFLFPI